MLAWWYVFLLRKTEGCLKFKGGTVVQNCTNLSNIVVEKDITPTKLSKITSLSQSNLWKTMNGQVPMNFSKLMKILVSTENENEKIKTVQEFLESTKKNRTLGQPCTTCI